jgi:membrane protease YdiL (CAAX protease family)
VGDALEDPGATLLALGAAATASLGAVALVNAEASSLDQGGRFLAVLGLAPLLLAIIAFLAPRPRAWFRSLGTRAPLAVGAFVAWGLFALEQAGSRPVNVYGLVVAFAGASAVTGVLGECSRRTPVLGPADALAFLALWIPLNTRWYRDLGDLPGDLDYGFFSLAVSTVALAGWASLRDIEQVGWRFPKKEDLAIAGGALLVLAAVLIPVGLATGFLAKPHAPKHEALEIAAEALGLFVLVALPEEVLFRGVLDSGLQANLGKPWLSLAISSGLFGLSHWPRSEKLDEKIAYCCFASVAGAVYGLAFRRSRGLPAAVLVHTAVDLVWKELLHK